jgi:ABC-type transporter MlaC component
LVGVLETGAAWGAKPHAAARYEAVMRALLLAVLMLLAGVPAFAQESAEPATPRSWQSLTPQQQQLLHNFQGNWDSLPAEKQQALTRGSDRWIHMTPEERSGAQERFKTWRALPPEQRQQLRERWRQFKALPPEQQQQIRRQFNTFRQMPPAQQQALRNAWRNMSPEQRNQWRNMSPEQRRGALEHSAGAMPRGPAGGHSGPGPHAVPRRPH